MINTKNLNDARKLIKLSNKKPITIQSQDLEFNRKILEYGKFDVLLFPEETNQKKDKLRQLDIGLNHIMAKIAAKNNISIGINLKKIRESDKKEKAVLLSRITEIIKTCRKTQAKMKAINYDDKKNVFELFISLGASTLQADQVVN